MERANKAEKGECLTPYQGGDWPYGQEFRQRKSPPRKREKKNKRMIKEER